MAESTASATRVVRVFLSHAPEDQALRDAFAKHITVLVRHGLVFVEDVDHAEVIVLLVSADYLALTAAPDSVVDRALARSERGEARVVPVILRSCMWETAPFGNRLASPVDPRDPRPPKAKPVTLWDDQDRALTVAASDVRSLVERLRA